MTHLKRSPYEPDFVEKPEKDPGRGVGGRPLKKGEPEAEAPAPVPPAAEEVEAETDAEE